MNLRIKKQIFLCLLSVAVLPQLGAQKSSTEPLAVSIAHAKELALKNNQTIKNANLDVTIAKKKVFETTAIGLPQVSLSANYQHIPNVPNFSFPIVGFTQSPLTPSGSFPSGFTQTTNNTPGGLNMYTFEGEPLPLMPKDNTTFTLQVSQLIFSGEYLVGLQASKVYKTFSEQALVKNRIEIGSTVESTYYMALVTDENLSVVKQSKLLMEKMLREMEATEKAGFIEDTDVDQLRLNVKTIENFEQSLQGQLKNIKNQLKFMMGIDMVVELTLTDKLDATTEKISPFDGSSFDVNQHIDYKMAGNKNTYMYQ